MLQRLLRYPLALIFMFSTAKANGEPFHDVVFASDSTLYLPFVTRNFDPSYVSPFGIAMFGLLEPATGLDKMREAGSRWIMTAFSWAEIQPVEGGPYNFSGVDAKVQNAAAAGAELYVLFDNNPAWVTSAPRGPVPADKLDDLENVVQALSQRYNGRQGFPRVDYWSFYGEPDNTSAWGTQATQYAAMLARVSPIVHDANPSAKVLIGGVAYDLFTDDELHEPNGPFVRAFLPNVLQALNQNHGGAVRYIDAVAFHFYPISFPRWPTIREKALEIRGLMSQHGVGHLPLIVPEMSMWSEWPDGQGGYFETQDQQARWLVHFFVRGLSVGIQHLYWFQVFDLVPKSPGSTQGLFKGLDLNAPKKSYFAYKVMTSELDRARYSSALAVAGVEGYTFLLDGRPKHVVWGTSQSPSNIDFVQTCVRKVSLLGAAATITDGGPGDADQATNGRIRLTVTFDEPIYVGVCP